MRNLIIIAQNTFTETLRQPIYSVIIGLTLLLNIFTPPLTMFTMDEDTELLKDAGLSTLMIAGLFLAVFSAARVVTEEIENKTVLTVLSKTVHRATFILAKYVGIALAVLLALYILGIVYLLISRIGVAMAAYDEKTDWVVEPVGWGSIALALFVPMACNYLYNWKFGTVFTFFAAILATLNLVLAGIFTRTWEWNPAASGMDWNLLGPLLLTAFAVLVITAVALAAATRLNLVMTLLVCSVIFILGLMMGPELGRVLQESSGMNHRLAWVAMGILPCLNFFVASNAIYNETPVAASYIAQVGLYTAFYVGGLLCLTIALFRHREVG